MISPEALRTRVRACLPELVSLRHRFHTIPETAGEEVETSALIRQVIAPTRLEAHAPYLGTDVVALLRSEVPGINVTLRADIDALPVTEPPGKSYGSTHPGKMHACGHDGHIVMLLGAAKILSDLAGEGAFAGSVRFVWQPGEEVVAMARRLVETGCLDDPAPSLVAALHSWPGTKLGVFTTRPGPVMAASAHFRILLKGRGGHGSAPQNTIDPIVAGARLVESLQSVVSRECNPQSPAVLSICRFSSGSNSNIIPGEALLEGTARYLDDETGRVIERGMRRTLDGLSAMTGIAYEFDYHVPYLPVANDPAAAELARQTVLEYLGEDRFEPMPLPKMGAEDFCYYARRYPAVYCHVGTGMDAPGLHSAQYDFPDGLIESGVTYFVALALKRLSLGA